MQSRSEINKHHEAYYMQRIELDTSNSDLKTDRKLLGAVGGVGGEHEAVRLSFDLQHHQLDAAGHGRPVLADELGPVAALFLPAARKQQTRVPPALVDVVTRGYRQDSQVGHVERAKVKVRIL